MEDIMYYFQTNKKNPTNTNCNSKKAKVIKSLCNFAVLISIGIASITSSFAEQQLAYGNYPILRGLTNPQEVSENFKISDAGLNLRQMVMLSSLDIIKPSKGKISPNKKITNNELIKAMVKLSGLDKHSVALREGECHDSSVDKKYNWNGYSFVIHFGK